MATAKTRKKETNPVIPEEPTNAVAPEEPFEEEGMVIVSPPEEPEKKQSDDEQLMEDEMTFSEGEKKTKHTGPMVEVFLPRLEDDGSIKVDQYEHVTIANEKGEPERWRILRGERVMVPVRVFMVLHEKYGKDI